MEVENEKGVCFGELSLSRGRCQMMTQKMKRGSFLFCTLCYIEQVCRENMRATEKLPFVGASYFSSEVEEEEDEGV